jgi:hypothetical protein
MRRFLVIFALCVLVGCNSNSKTECESRGGTCSQVTPGACLGKFIPNGDGYACDSSEVCCLPLSQSPCEVAGGTCVEVGTCSHGTVSTTSASACSNAGGPAECCIPLGDAGT